MRASSFVFCRYHMRIRDAAALSVRREFSLLEELRGKRITYRIKDPTPDQADTYLCKPRSKTIGDSVVHTWVVARDISYRQRTTYDDSDDDLHSEFVETDETQHAKFIALPQQGLLAIEDRTADDAITASSAISRFVTIVDRLTQDRVIADVELGGRPADVFKALKTWNLDRFTFSARPFNPTLRKPGDILHQLMAADHAGSITATVRPDSSHTMRANEGGIIAEAASLAAADYGQIGASGMTPSGLRATLAKPKFDNDKEKNARNSAENRELKVYIEDCLTEEAEETAVIQALLEIYGG